MSRYKQGDLVWVNYPFSDNFAESKRRPAIVISNELSNSLDNDVLLAPITTQLRSDEFSFILYNEDLTQPLPQLSEVRCNKIITIRENLIIAKLSELASNRVENLIKMVIKAFL